jgi:hypothetical protein
VTIASTWARLRRLVLPVMFLASLLVASAATLGEPSAGAATPHRAAVIVDTGAGVHRVVITFTEDSITGIDALQRAGAEPVIYSFNGQGGAVCRVFGVGRDSGPDCLGGQDGDNRYWAYFKAPAGTSSFTYSNVGAGTAKVQDGDVEGWRFGTGTAPEFVSLQSLVPPEPPGPANPPVAPVGPGATSGPTQQGPAGRGSQGIADATASVSTLPTTGDTKAGTAVGATGPDAVSDAPGASAGNESRADDQRAAQTKDTSEAALASSSSDDSSSAASLIWFVVLLAVIVGAIIVARRIRRRSADAAA